MFAYWEGERGEEGIEGEKKGKSERERKGQKPRQKKTGVQERIEWDNGWAQKGGRRRQGKNKMDAQKTISWFSSDF